MKKLLLVWPLALACSLIASASDGPAVAPPIFDKNLIGSPQFFTTAGNQSAGTACVARVSGYNQCYILTARHLLGPNGGFAKETSLAEVPDFVKGIRFHPLEGNDHYYTTKGLLIAEDPQDTTELWNDIAIFPLQTTPNNALLLAEKPPTVGDPVWVVAQVRGGVPEGEIMHLARVSAVDDKWVSAIFDNDHIVTNGASGAPVLNAAGEVVGVYHGHFDQDGHIGANIISAARITADIKAVASAAAAH